MAANEVNIKKRFQEASFIEAAMFGFITAMKFHNNNEVPFNQAATLFFNHLNIDIGDTDIHNARINYYRTQQKVRDTIKTRKLINPFPSQVAEVMRELNFMLAENNLQLQNILERTEFINEMIDKIESNGRR